MRPSLSSAYGGKTGSEQSILSDRSLSHTEDMMLIDFKTGSSRSILSFEHLSPQDPMLNEERQCSNNDSVADDDVHFLPSHMMKSHDCPIGPLILKLERVSTGDSVVPLNENIRMSSAEWVVDNINADSSEAIGTGMNPSQLVDHEYPAAISFDENQILIDIEPAEYPSSTRKMQPTEYARPTFNSITLMNEPIKIPSSRWVQDFQHDVSDNMGPMEPSMIFPDPNASVDSSPASSITSKKTRKTRPRSISQHTIEPTDKDILFGRGGNTNSHPGNVRFREEALHLRPHYEQLTKAEKFGISVVLLERMKNEERRFLEKASDGKWHEVDDKGARKKASQALRERLRSMSP